MFKIFIHSGGQGVKYYCGKKAIKPASEVCDALHCSLPTKYSSTSIILRSHPLFSGQLSKSQNNCTKGWGLKRPSTSWYTDLLLVWLHFKNMMKGKTVRDRNWWQLILDQWCCSCHVFVSKWSNVSAQDYANLWWTSIVRATSIKRPLSGTQGCSSRLM